MNLKFAIATVSALALLTGVAHAGDNFANVEQAGSENDGVITQGPGVGNAVGTLADAARQSGSENQLDITQSGSTNEVGTQAAGFDQSGSRNEAGILQSSSENVVGEVQQVDHTGDSLRTRNSLTITQQGGDDNRIGSVQQTRESGGLLDRFRDGNDARVTQGTAAGGGSNRVDLVSQDGRENGIEAVQSSSDNAIGGIVQHGNGNGASVTQETGNGNVVGTVGQDGAGNQASLSFSGQLNGAAAFNATKVGTFGGFGALVQGSAYQSGTANLLGLVVDGDSNAFGFNQDGAANSINGVMTGNGNQVGVGQEGTANFADVQISSGNFNEVYIAQDSPLLSLGNFASAAIAGDSNGVGISQTGRNNVASAGIIGNDNLVTATQGQTGSSGSNILGVLLTGDGNHVTSSQTISGRGANLAAVNVTGSGNYLDIAQSKSGSGNKGNTLAVNIFGDDNNNPAMLGFGFDGAALSAAGGLMPGQIVQSGRGNVIAMNVGLTDPASNSNQFAFSQTGDSNQIFGAVNGSFNQAAVVQAGAGNFVSFSQTGNYNILGVSQ
jgi:hypothetical protein